jgi:hypothetical protein
VLVECCIPDVCMCMLHPRCMYVHVESQMRAYESRVRQGYSGEACEITQRCPGNCSGHGRCEYGKCVCIPGRVGEACQQALKCVNNCHSHGICKAGSCHCYPGYVGSDCGVELPCVNNCSGQGACTLGQCFCNPVRRPKPTGSPTSLGRTNPGPHPAPPVLISGEDR